MRAASLILVALLLPTLAPATARAQPGTAGPGVGAPGGQAPPSNLHLLTPEERQLLLRGEIGPGEHIAGGLLGTFFGYGVGHAVQGRFSDKGWIFLLGEGAATVAVTVWLIGCLESGFPHSEHEPRDRCEDRLGLLVGGLVAMSVFRIWELVDVWAGPQSHNARVRRIRARLQGGGGPRWYAAPTFGDGSVTGGVAGLELRF